MLLPTTDTKAGRSSSMHPIARLIGQRLLLGLLTLFVVSLIIFLSVELLPGDLAEAILGQSATVETVAAFRRDLGLDLPPHERYLGWLGGMVQGDFGQSLATKRPIADLLAGRLGNTLFLAGLAALIAVPISLLPRNPGCPLPQQLAGSRRQSGGAGGDLHARILHRLHPDRVPGGTGRYFSGDLQYRPGSRPGRTASTARCCRRSR